MFLSENRSRQESGIIQLRFPGSWNGIQGLVEEIKDFQVKSSKLRADNRIFQVFKDPTFQSYLESGLKKSKDLKDPIFQEESEKLSFKYSNIYIFILNSFRLQF